MSATRSRFPPGASPWWAALLAVSLAAGCASAPPAPETAPPPPPGSVTPQSVSPTPEPSTAPATVIIPGGEPPPTPRTARPASPPGGPQGTLRVIVTLNVPFTPEGDLSDEAVRAQRAAIARAGADLMASLDGQNAVVVTQFEAVPQIVLVVDDAAMSVLIHSPLVAHVQQDEAVPPAISP